MNTTEVARQLVELCRAGKFTEAMSKFYSPSIVSVEPMEMHGMPREMKGLDAVRKKTEWWEANHTVNEMKANGPFVNGDKFAIIFEIDVTEKKSGKRHKGSEVAVYTVANDKIVHEEFMAGTQ